MSKYAEPKHVRLYHAQEDVISKLLTDKQFCYTNGIATLADVVRKSLNKYLKEYEMQRDYRDI